VLLRRTRLGLLAAKQLRASDSEAVARVARALGDELGWDERRVALELERFRVEGEIEGMLAEA
jgi:glycerol-3-phosphate dehydrogenase